MQDPIRMPYASDLQGGVLAKVGMLAIHKIHLVVACPIRKPRRHLGQTGDDKSCPVVIRRSGHAPDYFFEDLFLLG